MESSGTKIRIRIIYNPIVSTFLTNVLFTLHILVRVFPWSVRQVWRFARLLSLFSSFISSVHHRFVFLVFLELEPLVCLWLIYDWTLICQVAHSHGEARKVWMNSKDTNPIPIFQNFPIIILPLYMLLNLLQWHFSVAFWRLYFVNQQRGPTLAKSYFFFFSFCGQISVYPNGLQESWGPRPSSSIPSLWGLSRESLSFQMAFCLVISRTSRTKRVLSNKHLLKMTGHVCETSQVEDIWFGGGVYVGGLVMGSFRLKMCASLSIYLLGCGCSLSHMWKVCCCHRNSQYCVVYWFIIESKLAGTPAKTSWTEDGNLYLSLRKEFNRAYYRNCINNFHAWLGIAGKSWRL